MAAKKAAEDAEKVLEEAEKLAEQERSLGIHQVVRIMYKHVLIMDS